MRHQLSYHQQAIASPFPAEMYRVRGTHLFHALSGARPRAHPQRMDFPRPHFRHAPNTSYSYRRPPSTRATGPGACRHTCRRVRWARVACHRSRARAALPRAVSPTGRRRLRRPAPWRTGGELAPQAGRRAGRGRREVASAVVGRGAGPLMQRVRRQDKYYIDQMERTRSNDEYNNNKTTRRKTNSIPTDVISLRALRNYHSICVSMYNI